MRGYVMAVGTAIIIGLVLLFSMTKCVDVANAATSITWETMYDENHSVFCATHVDGWGKVIDSVSCVYVPRDTVRKLRR